MRRLMVEESPSWKKGLAEMVGTFALVFVGVTAIIRTSGGDIVAVALAHGLTIAVFASATMHISGGQFNPAVTLGLLSTRKITMGQAGVNILSQLVGGVLGGFVAYYGLGKPDAAALGAGSTFGTPNLASGVHWGEGLLVEAVLTFFLMFVIMGTAVDPRFGGRLGGLAIGLTVSLDILAGGAITGAAMNPARWVGSALPAMQTGIDTAFLANAWIYFVAPILGALAAALVYQHALLDEPRPRPEPQAQMRARDV